MSVVMHRCSTETASCQCTHQRWRQLWQRARTQAGQARGTHRSITQLVTSSPCCKHVSGLASRPLHAMYALLTLEQRTATCFEIAMSMADVGGGVLELSAIVTALIPKAEQRDGCAKVHRPKERVGQVQRAGAGAGDGGARWYAAARRCELGVSNDWFTIAAGTVSIDLSFDTRECPVFGPGGARLCDHGWRGAPRPLLFVLHLLWSLCYSLLIAQLR